MGDLLLMLFCVGFVFSVFVVGLYEMVEHIHKNKIRREDSKPKTYDPPLTLHKRERRKRHE